MFVDVLQHTTAPRDVVWDVLTAWERQPEWMADAIDVEVVSAVREGVGVTIRCPTRILGLVVTDIMRVTRWVEGEVIEVVHLGTVITGTGAFELTDTADGGTDIRWWEDAAPPGGALGQFAANTLVAPVTRAIFRRSLRQLAAVCEQEAAARAAHDEQHSDA